MKKILFNSIIAICFFSSITKLNAQCTITSTISGVLTICNGSSTSLTLTTSNGLAPYTYSWTPSTGLSSTTGSVVTAMPAITTTYTGTVTDANACLKTATVTVTVNALPAVSAGLDNTICSGGSTTNSATGAGSYTWNPGGFVGAVQNVTPLTTTNYTVVGTNTATGCTNSDIKIVFVNPNPTANAGPTRTLTCTNTSTTLAGSGGGAYSWTGPAIVSGATTANPTINLPGTYSLIVNVSGCSSALSTVFVPTNTTAPSPTASNSGQLTCSTTTVSLTGGPSAGVTYLWSGPGITGSTSSQTTSANTPGNYTLTATSIASGCVNTAVTAVTQNIVPPSVTASTSGTLTCNTLTVALNGGPAGMVYSWTGPGISGSATTQNTAANALGIYTLTVINAVNSCTNSANTNVTQNTVSPIVTASVNNTLTCINSMANAIATTTTSSVIYNWSGTGIIAGAGTGTITVNAPGIKNCTVTNTINGCATTVTVAVSQNTTIPTTTASTTGTMTCTNPTVNLNSSLAGMIYTWTAPGGGSVSSSNTQNTIGSGAGTYSLTVVNPSNGCSYLTTTSVSQNTTMPTGVSAGPNQMITCANSVVPLNGSVSSPTNATVNWTGGVCGSFTNLMTSACSGGVYTLTATHPVSGCISTSTVSVFVDVAIPTITLSANSSTISCNNPTVSVIASTTITPVSYNWSPSSGIITGSETTATPSFSAPGTYSLVVTNTINGCATNSAANVVSVFQDQSMPMVSLSSNSGTLTCLISSIVVFSSVSPSSGVIYSWSPSAGISTPTNQSNATFSAAGVYSLVVTNTVNGCASAPNTFMVMSDNTPPSITISGNTNICKGSTTNLTASGATSYTWDSGANTSSISVTPTISTSYTVTGENGNGCSSTLTTMVSIISSKSITGIITNTNVATGGDVILYRYTAALSQWDSVTVTPLTSSYTFNNIDSALYVVRAIPTATNIQVTYGTSSINWQNTTVITHGCTSNTNQNITLIPLTPFTPGPGVLTGTITQATGFGHRMSSEFKPLAPGQPIGGIVVKGGRNPGGQMLVQTTTNASGQYTLSGLPLSSGDEYFVFVDIPGLDTNGTYHLIIATGSTQITGLNFTVDSIYINPIGSVTAISQEKSILDNKILMFPNPANQYASIQYELIESATVKIELYDVIGNKVKTISEVNRQEKNKYDHIVNLDNLNSGIYFVKLKINNSETVLKLILTR